MRAGSCGGWAGVAEPCRWMLLSLVATVFVPFACGGSEHLDARDTRVSSDSADSADSVDSVDSADAVDSADVTDSLDSLDASDGVSLDGTDSASPVDGVEQDGDSDDISELPEQLEDWVDPAPLDATPLGDGRGVAVWVTRVIQAPGPPGVVEGRTVEEDVVGPPTDTDADAGSDAGPTAPGQLLGTALLDEVPAFVAYRSTPDGVEDHPFDVAKGPRPGSDFKPDAPRLVVFAPDHDAAVVVLLPWPGSGSSQPYIPERAASSLVSAGSPSRFGLYRDGLIVELLAQTGVADATSFVGLTLGPSVAARPDVASLVASRRPIVLKVYHGARPFLLRPDCISGESCAPGGDHHPCVSGCACVCNDVSCDCEWTGLESQMKGRALDMARRWVGPDGDLSLVRLHYVFKRSLGGTSSCDQNGEVDVSAETYGRFFASAVEAATRVNTELGFPLIHTVSPMNEANHPLQDGPQVNGAGQGTAAGFLDFREAIVQATGCAADRYVADRPDVLAMLADALVRGEAARQDNVLAPEVAMSLYLDVEQTDPFQVGDDGEPASVVTPLPTFLPDLHEHLAGRVFGDDAIWVDTYPGSWAPPWSELGGARHIDPQSGDLVRADPRFAAESAVARALTAADDFAAVFGRKVNVALGEVGWSTFDLDDEAQARFLEHLALVSRATAARDDRYLGFLWFKDTDRGARTFPGWTVGELPGGGVTLPCNDSTLATWLCMIDVFDHMEAAWGLFGAGPDAAEKPGWSAFIRAVESTPAMPPRRGSATD